nr:MAG TPA: hypothetical protein [Caudoviricetes sp.]
MIPYYHIIFYLTITLFLPLFYPVFTFFKILLAFEF